LSLKELQVLHSKCYNFSLAQRTEHVDVGAGDEVALFGGEQHGCAHAAVAFNCVGGGGGLGFGLDLRLRLRLGLRWLWLVQDFLKKKPALKTPQPPTQTRNSVLKPPEPKHLHSSIETP